MLTTREAQTGWVSKPGRSSSWRKKRMDSPKETVRALFQWDPNAALSLMAIAEITGLPKKQIVEVLRAFERDGDVEATWHEVIYLWEWIGDGR
jgi:hypothetical protein